MPLTTLPDDRMACRARSVQWRVPPREPSQAINGVYHCYCMELVERDVADSLPSARAMPLAGSGFRVLAAWGATTSVVHHGRIIGQMAAQHKSTVTPGTNNANAQSN
jgi:hypothetical protein